MTWSPCLDCTSLLMRGWLPPMLLLLLPLRALRLAAPEASAEQQDQEHPEGSGHCGSPQSGFTFRELESLPPGLLARASKLNVQQLLRLVPQFAVRLTSRLTGVRNYLVTRGGKN